MVAKGDSGAGHGRLLVKGYRVSLGNDENVLKLIVAMIAQLCKYTKSH